MKPILKKAAAAVAIKEGIDKLQEMRKPKKPSLAQRLLPFGIVAVVTGLGLFLYKSKFSGDDSGLESEGSSGTTGGTF